jgi:hypothetical protein
MRQSIYRGIDVSTKKMVQGCLVWNKYEQPFIRACFEIHSSIYELPEFEDVDVIPETIGQFTHKVDPTGKDIFEGDYLKRVNYLYEVVFDTDTAAFLRKTIARRGPDSKWYSSGPSAPDHVGRCYPFHVDPAMNGVVMGNKFDGLLEIVEG